MYSHHMSNKLNLALALLILLLAGWQIFKPSTKPLLVNSEKGTETMKPSPTNKAKEAKKYAEAKQVIKSGKTYTAKIQTTAGDLTVELSKDTPVTTNNFVFLAKEGFYDSVIFHRVIPGFMIQGGDPTGTGMGGPGYKFSDEKFSGEYKRGTIAMANSGPNTNGSQFFIMHADYPLPPNYVIFGKTLEGLDVVDKIASGKTGPNDRPVEPVSIKSIEIQEQ